VNSAKATGAQQRAAALGAELQALGAVLGLFAMPAAQWFRLAKPAASAAGETAAGASDAASGVATAAPPRIDDAQVEARIAARAAARRAKNWAESDRIRAELATAGVLLEDKPGGKTSWRRA
jgi:cysteinyl-tRNA synthetase